MDTVGKLRRPVQINLAYCNTEENPTTMSDRPQKKRRLEESLAGSSRLPRIDGSQTVNESPNQRPDQNTQR
jgi:hypothetical protein